MDDAVLPRAALVRVARFARPCDRASLRLMCREMARLASVPRCRGEEMWFWSIREALAEAAPCRGVRVWARDAPYGGKKQFGAATVAMMERMLQRERALGREMCFYEVVHAPPWKEVAGDHDLLPSVPDQKTRFYLDLEYNRAENPAPPIGDDKELLRVVVADCARFLSRAVGEMGVTHPRIRPVLTVAHNADKFSAHAVFMIRGCPPAGNALPPVSSSAADANPTGDASPARGDALPVVSLSPVAGGDALPPVSSSSAAGGASPTAPPAGSSSPTAEAEIVFPDNWAVGALYRRWEDEHRHTGTPGFYYHGGAFVADQGVYTARRQFRMAGSTKKGQKRPLLPPPGQPAPPLRDTLVQHHEDATFQGPARTTPFFVLRGVTEVDGSEPCGTSTTWSQRPTPAKRRQQQQQQRPRGRALKRARTGVNTLGDACVHWIETTLQDKAYAREVLVSGPRMHVKLTGGQRCAIRGREHKGNNVYYNIDIGVAAAAVQGCNDGDCIATGKQPIIPMPDELKIRAECAAAVMRLQMRMAVFE